MTARTIGIDATTWWNRRGFGRYTRLLIGAMIDQARGHRFILFVDRPPAPEMTHPQVRIVEVATTRTVTDAAVADGSRSVRDLLAFRAAVLREQLDVMYFPAVYSWYPTGGRTPTAVTFHDAIAEHYPKLVLPRRRERLMWNAKIWLAKRTAARLTTVSNAARAEIARYLHVAPARIAVILEAADPRFRPVADPAECSAIRARLRLPPTQRLILYVGGLAPHKNLLGLIDGYAHALADPAMRDVDLVIAGDPAGDGFHSHADELHARIAAAPALAGRVHFTGFVTEEDLPGLYSTATAVAMPAFSEGFGLPAVEAIACGTPVIATADGAVAEVVGPAGLFFDTRDPADIARVMTALVSDAALEQRLRDACPRRTAELDWCSSASAMLDLLEQCAERR